MRLTREDSLGFSVEHWRNFFHEKLVEEKTPIRLIAFTQNFLGETLKFFGFILYLLDKKTSVKSVISTGIFHHFVKYNFYLLDAQEEAPIPLFFPLMRETSHACLQELEAALLQCRVKIRQDLNIAFSLDKAGKVVVRYVSWLGDSGEYHLPPVAYHMSVQNLLGLYQCFRGDFLLNLRVTRDPIFESFFQSLVGAELADQFVSDLYRVAFFQAEYEKAERLLILLAKVLGSTIDSFLSRHPQYFYMAALPQSKKNSFVSNQCYVVEQGLLLQDSDVSITGLRLVVDFLVRSNTSAETSIIFSLLRLLGKIAIANSALILDDESLYGIPLLLLSKLANIPHIERSVHFVIAEKNELVYQKIRDNAAFSDIKTHWALPALNIYKLFLISPPKTEYLLSVQSLKMMMLREMWLAADASIQDAHVIDLFLMRIGLTDALEKKELAVADLLCNALLEWSDDYFVNTLISYIAEHFEGEWEGIILKKGTAIRKKFIEGDHTCIFQKMSLKQEDYYDLFFETTHKMQQFCFASLDWQVLSINEAAKLLAHVLDKRLDNFAKVVFSEFDIAESDGRVLLTGEPPYLVALKAFTPDIRKIHLCCMVASQDRIFFKARLLCLARHTIAYDLLNVIFDYAFRAKISTREIIKIVVERAFQKKYAFFGDALDWWRNRPANEFYIACALEVILKRYQGSRAADIHHMLDFGKVRLTDLERFFQENTAFFYQATKLNKAMSKLLSQAKGEKPVELHSIIAPWVEAEIHCISSCFNQPRDF